MYVYLCGQLSFLALCYLVMNDYVLRYFTEVFLSLVHGTAPSTLKIPCYDRIQRLLCMISVLLPSAILGLFSAQQIFTFPIDYHV